MHRLVANDVLQLAKELFAPDVDGDVVIGEVSIVLALEAGRLVGLAAMYRPQRFLHSLYVTERGRGIGKALLDHVIAAAGGTLSLKCQAANIGAQAFYSLWASELFATPYRASAQGVMFSVVRSVTGLLSYFFPTLLAVTGLTAVGLLLIGLLTVALLIGAIWAPQTRGKTLREIEVERYGTPVQSAPVVASAATGQVA